MSDNEASKWAQQHMNNLRRETEGYENSEEDNVKEWQVELLARQIREISERVDEIPTKLDDIRYTLESRIGELQSALWLLGISAVVLVGLILWRIW